MQWCRSRTVRRRSSTAGRAAPQGCGPSCGPSSSTLPTSRRCAAHLHTHTRSQGCLAMEADTVCYEADTAVAFPKTACLLPDVILAALFISSQEQKAPVDPSSSWVLAPWCVAAGCSPVHMFKWLKSLAIQRVSLNSAAACGAPRQNARVQTLLSVAATVIKQKVRDKD